MKNALLVITFATVLAAAVVRFFPDQVDAVFRVIAHREVAPASPPPAPDLEKYAALRESLASWRDALAAQYQQAGSEAARAAVLDDARVVLETMLPEMMRCWLGTPWDFNGIASGPGETPVACGYFVSTVLRDAGFLVHRYHLAQQPSGNIMRTFLPRASCKLTVGMEYAAFADALESADPGVYIVGLDTHVGFIVVGADGFRFIHSSGSRPWAVVDESRDDARVLEASNWRMLGHLTADRAVLRKWLAGTRFPVHGR